MCNPKVRVLMLKGEKGDRGSDGDFTEASLRTYMANNYDALINGNNIVGEKSRQGWTPFTNGQDLNTITNLGVYYTTSNANAQSLVNSPVAVQFKMTVEISNGGAGRRQQIEAMSVQRDWAGQIWRRNSENAGTTWSDWIHMPLQSEVTAIANRSAKNLLQGVLRRSVTSNGITATKNEDGSITVNGTATANFILTLGLFTNTLNGERVTLTGCPEGGSGNTYVLRAYNEGTTIQNDYGSGVSFAVPSTNNFNVRLVVFQGTTVTDLTFYPMLRFESVQDDTYVPYGMTNAELTEEGMVEKGLMPTPTSDLDILHLPQGTYKVNVANGIVTSGYLPARYGTLTIIRGKDDSTGDYVSAMFCVALSSTPSVYFRTGLDSPSNPNWITSWLKMATE